MTKKYCFIITISSLALLLLVVLYMLGFFEYMYSIIKEEYKSLEFLKTIGGLMVAITSIVLFYLSQSKKNNDFLTLNLAVSKGKECKIITTSLTNPVNSYKHVKFACLVITRVKSDTPKITNENKYVDFVKMINEFTNSNIKYTNDIIKLKNHNVTIIQDGEFAFIPLPFFFSENVRFGNEIVSYSYPLMDNSIKKGIYDVRLFVFRSNGLHRTTQAILEM